MKGRLPLFALPLLLVVIVAGVFAPMALAEPVVMPPGMYTLVGNPSTPPEGFVWVMANGTTMVAGGRDLELNEDGVWAGSNPPDTFTFHLDGTFEWVRWPAPPQNGPANTYTGTYSGPN